MADITSNKVLEYKFRNSAADTAGSFTGLPVNGPTYGAAPLYGIVFTAASSQRVSCQQTLNTIIALATQGTVAIRIQLSGTGDQTLFGHNSPSGASPEFGLQFLSGTCYAGFFNGTNYRPTVGTGSFPTGTPIHIALTWIQGAKSKLYVNGSLVATAANNLPTSGYQPSENLTVNGKMWSGSAYSSNTTYLFQVFSRELSVGDVTELYNYVEPIGSRSRSVNLGLGVGL